MEQELKRAIEALADYARKVGDPVELPPPLAAGGWPGMPALPAEYRALLALHDGLRVEDFRVLGSRDWQERTTLFQRAREFLDDSAQFEKAVGDCVPIANLGEPNHWLLYDPTGALRDGEPGFLVRLTADDLKVEGLAAALWRHLEIYREVMESPDDDLS